MNDVSSFVFYFICELWAKLSFSRLWFCNLNLYWHCPVLLPSLYWNWCCFSYLVMSQLSQAGRKKTQQTSAQKTPAKPRILLTDLADLTYWGVRVPVLFQHREWDCLPEASQFCVSIDSSWLQSWTTINLCPVLNRGNTCLLVKFSDLFWGLGWVEEMKCALPANTNAA